MSESVPPLDQQLIAALRVTRTAPREVQARVRSRLETVIPEMRRGAKAGTDGGKGQNRGLERFGVHPMGIATFLVGGIAGAALFAALSRAPAPQIVFVDRPTPQSLVPPAPPFTVPPVPSALGIQSTELAPVQALGSASSPPMQFAVPSRATSRPSRLTEERILLDEARAGLIQGDPERALNRIDLHRARFAGGLLAEERDAMQVEALVRAGHYGEARERAIAFRSRLPASLFLPTVESAIASIP